MLDVNVVGMVRVTRAALPHLRASAHAAIVNTCSIAATAGLPQRALYSATKGAVLALTLAMAADHVREGIRVNCVNPGTADTPWVRRLLAQAADPEAELAALKARQPIGRLVSADEVAAIELALAGDDEVDAVERVLEPDRVGDDVEARLELRADRGEPARRARRPRRRPPAARTSTPVRAAVLVGELLEPAGEQRDLRVASRPSAGRRRAPRRGTRSSTSHATVTVDPAERPAERLDRGEPAVGRRAPADADDHATCAAAQRGGDQLAGAARVDARSGSLRPVDEREPARPRHLDDRDAAGQHAPLRVDRIAERPGDARGAARAAARREQRVERALAAVGERQLDDRRRSRRARSPAAIARRGLAAA